MPGWQLTLLLFSDALAVSFGAVGCYLMNGAVVFHFDLDGLHCGESPALSPNEQRPREPSTGELVSIRPPWHGNV